MASPKKTSCPSPPGFRKSERLEKRTPTPPDMRKSRGLEKWGTPKALRRSERGKIQSSSSSSGSKTSNKRLDSSVTKKKLQEEKIVRQLTLEPNQGVKETATMSKEIKNARSYKKFMIQKSRKLDVLDSPSRNNRKGKVSGEKVPDLRDVPTSIDLEKTSSNCSVSKFSRQLLEMDREESSNSSHNIRSAGACHSEDQESLKDFEGGDGPLLSANKVISRKLDLEAETKNKNTNFKLVSSTLDGRAPDSDVRLESSYKETSLKRKRDKHDPQSNSTLMTSSKDIRPSDPEAINSFASAINLGETCALCLNRQRDKQEELCLCGAKSNQITCSAILAEEGNGADVTGELSGKPIFNLQSKDLPENFRLDADQNTCLTCKLGGKLLCCEGKGCKRSYHVSCLDPPLKDIPLEVWYCHACVEKKIKLGEHSVSEGIESIWKVEMSEENGSQKKHFFVKYKGLAHVHNRWVSESLLLLEAPSLLAKFNRKHQVLTWKDEWTEPHRMLQKRLLGSPKNTDEIHGGHVDGVFMWLVKWRGLDYEKATWELETSYFMKLPKAQSLISDYESRLERAMKRVHKEIEVGKGPFKPMQLSAGGSIEIDFFNSLREQWYKRQNVIIIDDQDRIMKVITFIASLPSDGCWPFVIITSSAASWDEDFFRLAPSLATVVYHGSKDTRRKIRAVEFHVEGGDVMFDVLVTSPEVVVEDIDVLQSIKWEVVIVDDCQRSRMYAHFGQFKSLSTKMRLLLVNGQLKDGIIEHLLPLLDCQKDASVSEGLIPNSDHRIHDLREKLSKYIIDLSKSDTSRFNEYWVPAQISNAQLEQYCATLLANTLPLCSSSNLKNDPVGVFRDIVISNRKCCDHPYIMDSLLAKHLTKDVLVTDFLDVGIKASGKLQLLDAMLLELRNRGLRVLILFQSSGGSPKDNIGDILDDFVRQRFGENSYERLEVLVNPGRKQTALNRFNNEKSRFVFLLETHACLPSVKLSSVDTVIIFGSDWNPANDLRSLQKITLDTQTQQLKIFRLYSSFTVEENALILAKHRKPLDSSLQSISRATGHNLLMWGVSYLFFKLDEFHGLPPVATSGSSSFDLVSHEDIIRDILNILTQNAKDCTASNCTILKAKQNHGNYSTDFPLPGEQTIQESDADLPHLFWKKMLDKKQPKWKYTSALSQCNRKRAQHRDEVLKKPEGEIEEGAKKRKKVTNNFDQASPRPAAAENDGLGDVLNSVHCEKNSGSTSHLNVNNANDTSTLKNVGLNNLELQAVDMDKFGERNDMPDSQKSLHALLKPEIAKVCELLKFPEDVKAMAQSFLEYVVNNHCIIKEPATVLQALHISLCWTAASILKYKVDRKESFELAKKHLQFGCRKEEADYVYSMLRCLKKMFIYRGKNLYSTETSDSLCNALDKVHHSKSSLSKPAVLQQEKDKFEDVAHSQDSAGDQALSQLGHGYKSSIKEIEKKCDKQITKLLEKQQVEINECKEKYENEKAQLELKKKTEAAVIRLHSSSSMRAVKLRQLDIEFKEKFEDINRRMEMDLENLQTSYKTAMEMVEKRKENWLRGFISWARMDSISNTGNASSLNSVENMQSRDNQIEIPETASTSDDPEVLISEVRYAGKQNPYRVKSYMSGGGPSPLGAATKNMGSPETSSAEAMVVVTTMPSENCSAPAVVCDYDAQLNQRDEVTCAVDAAPLSIMASGSGHNTAEKDDEEAVDTIVNEVSNAFDKTTAVTQENDAIPSEKPENPAGVEICGAMKQLDSDIPSAVPKTTDAINATTNDQLEKNSQSMDKVDGQVVVDKGAVIENPDSSERITVLSQQNEDSPSGVPEIAGQVQETITNDQLEKISQSSDNSDGELVPGVRSAPDEVTDNLSSGVENNGVREVGATLSVRPSQECNLITSQSTENDHRLVEGDIGNKDIDGVSSVNDEDNHPLASSPAREEQNSQQTASTLQYRLPSATENDSPSQQSAPTRSQDGIPSTMETDNPLQQNERSIDQADIAYDPTDADVLIADHVLQTPSPDTDVGPNVVDLPSAGEHEGNINNAECSAQMLGDQIEHSNQAVPCQPVGSQCPIGGSAMHVLDTRTGPVVSGASSSSTQPVPPPFRVPHVASGCDPLQNELERIRKETDHVIAIHENTKLQLKSDCEKEIQEIRRKYETKFQEVELDFISRKKELDVNHNKVLMNKILAEAFRSKCMDIKGSNTPILQQDVPSSFVQQLLQLSSQPTNVQRNIIPGLSRHQRAAPPPPQSLRPVHRSSTPAAASSMRPSHPSSSSAPPVPPNMRHLSPSPTLPRSVHYSAPSRPPLIINSISPAAAGNVGQPVNEIRAPAPHLQPFRPSNSSSHVHPQPVALPLPSSAVHKELRIHEDNNGRGLNQPQVVLGSNKDSAVIPEIGAKDDATDGVVFLSDDD